MKQTNNGYVMPTAGLCIHKSRLKVYNKESVPTYYLHKGQEFSIELFNPTSDTILAKIQLNGKYISQGGLVLRPGERVFLERYLDVARKFMFDTYEVSNTSEIKNAIKDNGDFRVEFYREQRPLYIPQPVYVPQVITTYPLNPFYYDVYTTCGGGGTSARSNMNISSQTYNSNSNQFMGGNACYTNTNSTGTFNINASSGTLNLCRSNASNVTLDSAQNNETYKSTLSDYTKSPKLRHKKEEKTIETGRVESGDYSNQRIETVSKSFEYLPFYTLEYKLLPMSQKMNTIDDINVKRYCVNCSSKLKPEWKFCPTCSARL